MFGLIIFSQALQHDSIIKMFLQIKRFYYCQLKEIMQPKNPKFNLWKHRYETAVMIFFELRIIICLIIHFNENSFNYLCLDPICYIVNKYKPNLYQQYLFLMMGLPGLGLIGKYVFHLNETDSWTFQLPYDIVVRNTDHLKKQKYSLTEQKNIFKQKYDRNMEKYSSNNLLSKNLAAWFCRNWTQLSYWFNMEQINRHLAHENRMKTYLYFSVECQLFICKTYRIIDVIMYQINIFLGKNLMSVEF